MDPKLVYINMPVSTPYGNGSVVEINPCYGVKVILTRSTQWFKFCELSPVSNMGLKRAA